MNKKHSRVQFHLKIGSSSFFSSFHNISFTLQSQLSIKSALWLLTLLWSVLRLSSNRVLYTHESKGEKALQLIRVFLLPPVEARNCRGGNKRPRGRWRQTQLFQKHNYLKFKPFLLSCAGREVNRNRRWRNQLLNFLLLRYWSHPSLNLFMIRDLIWLDLIYSWIMSNEMNDVFLIFFSFRLGSSLMDL